MATCVIMMKLTDHGVRNIKNAPARIEETIRTFESVGGKVKSFYSVIGEYDFACIVEAPNDEVIMAFSLELAASGNVKTTSLKAFNKDQFAMSLKQLDKLEVLAERIESEDR